MTPRQLLGQARVHTFDYIPYLASYVYSLREQECPGIGTAAVDAHGNLYWDPEYIVEIGKGAAAYLVAHETCHLVFDHCARAVEIIGEDADETQRLIINIAGDLVIEQTLSMMRHLRPAGAIHLGCVVPQLGNMKLDFPENKSMQEYRRLILEKLKEQQQKPEQGNQKQQPNPQQGGGGQGDDDLPPVQGDLDGEGEVQPGDNDPPPAGGESGQGDSQDGDSQKPGAPGMGGSCADGQPREYEKPGDGSWDAWGEDMAAAASEQAIAQFEAKGIGTVPGTIKEALAQKLRPQPDPFDQLRSAVCSSVAAPVGGRDFSHRRRSRKQPPGDDMPILHGRITVQPHAVVIVDTSGSMAGSDLKARALSVIGQGLRKLTRVKVYCADTNVRSSEIVTSTKRFEWAGGGGTNMSRALEEVDADEHPDSIVLVTDAQTNWPAKKTRARVVVAYTGDTASSYYRRIPTWCRTVVLNRGGQ
jgi:predicted metal-dependent peptidase